MSSAFTEQSLITILPRYLKRFTLLIGMPSIEIYVSREICFYQQMFCQVSLPVLFNNEETAVISRGLLWQMFTPLIWQALTEPINFTLLICRSFFPQVGLLPSSETQGQIVEARGSLNRQKKMATKKSIVGREEPLGTSSYQTSSKQQR